MAFEMKRKAASFKNLHATCLLLSLTSFASAAHWEVVSQTDSNYLTPPSIVGGLTRGSRTNFTFAIPSGFPGATFGTGAFKFRGEQETLGETTGYANSGNGVMWSFSDYVDAYYAFTYKWVADTVFDMPPGVGVSVNANGYYLERVHLQSDCFTGGGSLGVSQTGSLNATFNASSGGYATGAPWNYYDSHFTDFWPDPSGGTSGSILKGTDYFYVRGTVLGSGAVFYSGGLYQVTIYPLNHQQVDSSCSPNNLSGTGGYMQVAGTVEAYVCASQVNLQPVK